MSVLTALLLICCLLVAVIAKVRLQGKIVNGEDIVINGKTFVAAIKTQVSDEDQTN
jgi:hypothetical protein